jgi:hypothetical protein
VGLHIGEAYGQCDWPLAKHTAAGNFKFLPKKCQKTLIGTTNPNHPRDTHVAKKNKDDLFFCQPKGMVQAVGLASS